MTGSSPFLATKWIIYCHIDSLEPSWLSCNTNWLQSNPEASLGGEVKSIKLFGWKNDISVQESFHLTDNFYNVFISHKLCTDHELLMVYLHLFIRVAQLMRISPKFDINTLRLGQNVCHVADDIFK